MTGRIGPGGGDATADVARRPIRFRALIEEDLPLLHRWRNEAHVSAFFGGPVSLEEVAAKYRPRIRGEVPALYHLAYLDQRATGYLQCYRNRDFPAYAGEIGEETGVSVDFFVGEHDLLRRGLGSRMLREYVERVVFPSFADESACWICHRVDNGAARACSRRAGFRPIREVTEDGAPSELLLLERAGRPIRP